MSVFHRIPAAEVARNFTHRGWLGFCPVWVNERDWSVTERNWVPEWVMWLNLLAQDFAMFCIDAMGGEPPPGWKVHLTGRLDGVLCEQNPPNRPAVAAFGVELPH